MYKHPAIRFWRKQAHRDIQKYLDTLSDAIVYSLSLPSLCAMIHVATNRQIVNLTKERGCVKKVTTLVLAFVFVLGLTGCGKNDSYKIRITVPAGSTEVYVYSDEEISPTGNKITISSGEGLGDTEVVLKPIEVKEENAYDEPAYLTPGMPVKMDVEKGAWFKVGISMQNKTDTEITVYVEIEGVEVRIE